MLGLFGARVPQLSPEELLSRLDGGAAPVVIDVREPGEYSAGHIPGSRLMSLGTLPARVQDLPREREIVVVCLSGGRSAQATQFLRQAGYNALNLSGGMRAWRGPVVR